jgi:hypothetical protein
MKIVSNPEQVCFDHAMEFWTGLLVYARDRSAPCVKLESVCACPSCEELGASYLRAIAIKAAGPSPPDHERFQIRPPRNVDSLRSRTADSYGLSG